MYEHKQIINIGYSELFWDFFEFGLSLENTEFKFLNCNYSFKRGNKGHEEECLIATFYSDSSEKKSPRQNFEYELQILSYLTLLPLTSFDFRYEVREVENIIKVQPTGSKKKVQQIQEIGEIIKKQKATQDLFRNVVQVFNSALRFFYMGDQFCEEAFLGFFRVVEQIVSWSYNQEERAGRLPIIKHGKNLVPIMESKVDGWFQNYIGMYYSSKHYQSIVRNLLQNINESTRDIFSKINRFCFVHKIPFPADEIHELIRVRNSIVHGNIDDLNMLNNTITEMEMLALNAISHQFFHKKYCDLMKLQVGYVEFR